MFMTCYWYPHIVPTELKRGGDNVFYKHIVPTGLKYGTAPIVMSVQKGF